MFKTIFFAAACVVVSTNSTVRADPTVPAFEVDSAVGIRSNYGIVGMGVRVFPSAQIDLHLNLGFGYSGVATAVGVRYYFLHSTDPFLFLIPSTSALNIGFTVLNTSGGEATIDNNIAVYKTTNGRYFNIHVEHISWLWQRLALPLEVGYAFALRKPAYEFDSGTPDKDFEKAFDESAKSGFLISIGLGLAF